MKLTIVDPQNDYNLLKWVMTKVVADTRLPYNFYSIVDYGYRLDNLHPSPEIMKLLTDNGYGDGDSIKFDQAYANQILTNDASFIDFMSLMHEINRDEETILMSNYTSPIIMPILDSLLKFIQQRYGINGFIVNTEDDLDPFTYSEFGTLQQQVIFSDDCIRYYKLIGKPIPTASPEELAEDLKSLEESQPGV